MAGENKYLAILFADIVNSTKLYQTMGNEAARKFIGDCIDLLAETTRRHRGRVIKTIGDEIMCTFDEINDAVRAAIEMNRDVKEIRVDPKSGAFAPSIYVGIQLGPVIMEAEDVFGDGVNVAAQLVALAKQRQIVTTEETVDAMDLKLQKRARYIYKTNIKGQAGETRLYEIIWERIGATISLDFTGDQKAVDNHLVLRLGDQIFKINADQPVVTLGRHESNDLVIADDHVSRSHARIEYRRGKYVLVDESMNGTYILMEGEKTFRIKREEAQMTGKGFISLGRKMDPELSGKAYFVHFEIRYSENN
jgi:class 3 adenylate cyclase